MEVGERREKFIGVGIDFAISVGCMYKGDPWIVRCRHLEVSINELSVYGWHLMRDETVIRGMRSISHGVLST